MKKIIKLSIAFAFVLTAISTYASDDNSFFMIKKGNEKQVKFSLNGINKANVFIYDDEYSLIYSEIATGKEGVSRIYNLNEFPEGTYFFVAEANFKKVKYEIIINNGEICSVTNKEIL